MRRAHLIAITFLVSCHSVAHADDPTPPQGFTALFNGKDLSGWHGMPKFDPSKLLAMKEDDRKTQIEKWTDDAKKHWTVEKGEVVSDGKEPFLTTDQDFGDIELRFQCKGDVGLFLRSSATTGVLDPAKDRGEWFDVRILMVGERWTVVLNDKVHIDHERLQNFWKPKQPLPRKAPLQIGGQARLRNVFVREIPAAEANAILRAKGAKGFEDVFNGKDLTGWAGPVDQYEVKEAAIVCKPRKGGTIFTKAEYEDFVARVEYRLPPGGNNGLAIRYPGGGDTAYVGMCEIQVLDDTAKQYAKLDPRQYNGSAYGMTAAHRGYLRPVGDWNFEEVTIKGSTIKVELNGTMILDTDLSEVTKYMANSAHPGKTRTKGHFGFAGHSDPVAFRNVQIKVLEK